MFTLLCGQLFCEVWLKIQCCHMLCELLETSGSTHHKSLAFNEKCPLGTVLHSLDLTAWWRKEKTFSVKGIA